MLEFRPLLIRPSSQKATNSARTRLSSGPQPALKEAFPSWCTQCRGVHIVASVSTVGSTQQALMVRKTLVALSVRIINLPENPEDRPAYLGTLQGPQALEGIYRPVTMKILRAIQVSL